MPLEEGVIAPPGPVDTPKSEGQDAKILQFKPEISTEKPDSLAGIKDIDPATYARDAGLNPNIPEGTTGLAEIAKRIETGSDSDDILNNLAARGVSALEQPATEAQTSPALAVNARSIMDAPVLQSATEVEAAKKEAEAAGVKINLGESPIAPTSETIPTPAAETTAPPVVEAPSTPENTTSVGQFEKGIEIGGKLTELGIPVDSDQGKDIIKQLSENPDMMDGFAENIDKIKSEAPQLVKLMNGFGYSLSETEAIQFLLINNLDKLTSEDGESTDSLDPAKAEEARKKNILIRLLKAVYNGVKSVATAVGTGVAVGAVSGAGAALGSLGAKH